MFTTLDRYPGLAADYNTEARTP